MEQNTKKLWYQKKGLLILLLFIFPPLSIYGMIKRDSKSWKKALFLLFAFPMSFLFILVIIAILFPIDYYKQGNEKLKEGNIQNAISEFKKVSENDKYYQKAINKIDSLENSIAKIEAEKMQKLEVEQAKKDSIKIVNDSIKIIEEKALVKFQNDWANKIVKEWKGLFIVSYSMPSDNTIYFELGEEATKIFHTNREDNLPMYISRYKEDLSYFNSSLSKYPITIDFKPNQKLIDKQDNSISYVHPSLAYFGVKVYKGNEYYKEYLGTVSCLFEDDTKGWTDMYRKMVLIKGKNGNIIQIPYSNFRSSYWINQKDNDINKSVIDC